MSDPIITSEAEYHRNDQLMEETKARVRAQAKAGKWSMDRLATTMLDAVVPYYKAKSDPASPVATRMEREQWIKDINAQKAGTVEILDSARYPQWNAVVADETAQLNAIKGVHYPPPPIVLVNGLRTAHLTVMEFNHDTLMIDKKYFAEHADDPTLAAGMAHELAHRYQRSEDVMRLKLQTDEFGDQYVSAQEYERVKSLEAEADFDGRRVTPKGMMYGFLKNATLEMVAGLGFFLKSHPEMTQLDGKLYYEELASADRRNWEKAAVATPVATRDSYYNAGIVAFDMDGDLTHPKLGERLSLQTALDQYDGVLSCKNVQLDATAHVVEATECGPGKVPLIVNGVPNGEKLTR